MNDQFSLGDSSDSPLVKKTDPQTLKPEDKKPFSGQPPVNKSPPPAPPLPAAPVSPLTPPEPPEERSGKKPKRGKSKKLISFIALALVLIALPIGLLVVKQSQETRRQAIQDCNPDPDKCWTINSKSSQEACGAWCSSQDEYEDSCTSYKVFNDECEEVTCWSCKKKEIPTPGPGECQSNDLSKRTKEGCEVWCGCSPGGDIYNEYEDNCQQNTYSGSPDYMCWYCKKRPEPLNDCCGCWSECESLPCPKELVCQPVDGVKRCVNPSCPTEQDCICPENTPTPTLTPTVTNTPTPKVSLTPTPTGEPTATPTLPLSSISCEYCRIYDQDWRVVDLGSATVQVDQQIYLVAKGATSDLSGITKARFRITIDNQAGGWQESVQKRGEEYYLPYVVAQSGSFKVEAMVYNPDLGWH